MNSGIYPEAFGGSRTMDKPRSSTAKRIEALNSRAVWAYQVQPRLDRRYVVKGWLGRGGMSVVYGPSSSGKSFLCLDMGFAIAKGVPWHGVRIHAGPVLYIAGEGQDGFLNRVSALDAPGGLGLLILTCPVDLCRDLQGGEVLGTWIKSLAADHGEFAAVYVDTLARSLGDGDENSGPDMGAFIKNVDAIRSATGAHVCIVHHTGKDAAKGARGHSSLRAATDTEIELTTKDGISTAQVTKQRDGKIPPPFSYTLREVVLGADSDGDPVTTCIVEPCETPEKTPALGQRERRVLVALREYVADFGQPNPGGTGWPERGAFLCVPQDGFLDFAKGREPGDNPKDQRKTARRGLHALHEKGLVGINESHVWSITSRGTKGTKGDKSPPVPPSTSGGHWGDKGDNPL
jgi:hypothetical protein